METKVFAIPISRKNTQYLPFITANNTYFALNSGAFNLVVTISSTAERNVQRLGRLRDILGGAGLRSWIQIFKSLYWLFIVHGPFILYKVICQYMYATTGINQWLNK